MTILFNDKYNEIIKSTLSSKGGGNNRHPLEQTKLEQSYKPQAGVMGKVVGKFLSEL